VLDLIGEFEKMRSAAMASMELLQPREERTCVICLDHPPVMAILPCGHRCFCENDAAAIMSKKKLKIKRECPICRGPISAVQRVFDA
jgi:hypothetical protein